VHDLPLMITQVSPSNNQCWDGVTKYSNAGACIMLWPHVMSHQSLLYFDWH
jgi:hypothetical protein